MKTKRNLWYAAAAICAAMACAACVNEAEDDPEKDDPDAGTGGVTYNVSQQGYSYGVSGSETIAFEFSADVTLTKEAISVTSGTGEVTTGELSSSETGDGALSASNWFLAITVVKTGSVKVMVSLEGVETSVKTVDVYEADTITYNVNQQGYKAGASDSNTIAFAFSTDVTLTKEAISVESGTGEVTTGELSGSETDEGALYGPNWFLAITVVKAGNVTVKVTLTGVETAEKIVTVYKAADGVTAPEEPPEETTEDEPLEDTGSKTIEELALSGAVIITFDEDSAAVEGEADGVTSAVTGANVVITSSAEGVTYIAQGVTADGSLEINSSADYALYLNGASVTNTAGPAFNSTGAGAVSVTLVSSTTNRFYDTEGNTSVNAAFYSKGKNPLTFTEGDGVLELRGRGTAKGHAIAAKGDVTIAGGDIRVYEAASDGINAPSVTVTGGSFTSRSAGDGIQGDDGVTVSGGTLSIVTTGDKAHGLKGDGDTAPVTVSGAASLGIWVYGKGSKCVNAGGDVTISGGALNLSALGDSLDETTKWTGASCVKSDGNIAITDGFLTMSAAGGGGKCISADGDVVIRGGEIDLATTGSAFWDAYEADYSGVSCVKADGNITVEGNTVLSMRSSGGGGKCLSADGDIVIAGSAAISAVTTGGRLVKDSQNDTSAKAIKADGNLTVNGEPSIWISTSGSEAEGLESKNILTINGGYIEIEANDDCINASSQIVINGGTIYCNSSTNDGIDSNGTITVTGGLVVTAGAQGAEEGFDCDNSVFKITGGTLVGLGGNTSSPTTSACTQRSLVYKATSAVKFISVVKTSDNSAALVLDISRIKTYTQSPCLLFSSPGLENAGYTIYTGGSVAGGADFHGLNTGGVYTPGTKAATVTLSSMVTVSGNATGPGGGQFGGGPGGRGL